MLKAIYALCVTTILGCTLMLMRHSHHTSHSPAASEDTASAESAVTEFQSVAPEKNRAGAATAPQTRPAAGPKKFDRMTNDPKVHLDIAKLLLKNAAFRALNPGLTLEKFEAGVVDMNSIKLPPGLKLSYEYDPACKDAKNTVAASAALSSREKKNLESGAPAFITRPLGGDVSTVGDLSAQVSTDGCIRGLSFDAGNVAADKSASDLSAALQAQAEQKQAADQAIIDALKTDGSAKMAIVGLKSDLQSGDPTLMTRAADGHYPSSASTYAVSGSGDATASVDVTRRPFVVHTDDSGSFSDSEVSNAIIHASNRGYKVINVTTPDFSSANYQAAVDYAQAHGATVVVNIPIPVAKSKPPATVPSK